MALPGPFPGPSLEPPWASLDHPWTLLDVSWFVLGLLGVPQKKLKTSAEEHMALQGTSKDPQLTPDVPQMTLSRHQMIAWTAQMTSRWVQISPGMGPTASG